MNTSHMFNINIMQCLVLSCSTNKNLDSNLLKIQTHSLNAPREHFAHFTIDTSIDANISPCMMWCLFEQYTRNSRLRVGFAWWHSLSSFISQSIKCSIAIRWSIIDRYSFRLFIIDGNAHKRCMWLLTTRQRFEISLKSIP
jgi:hypothetical protein